MRLQTAPSAATRSALLVAVLHALVSRRAIPGTVAAIAVVATLANLCANFGEDETALLALLDDALERDSALVNWREMKAALR